MDFRLALCVTLLLLLGVVQLVGSALQISPSPLLLTSLGGVAQDQDPEPLIFSCLEVREGSTPQRPRAHVVWLKDGEVIVTENDKKYRHYRKKKWLLVNNVSYSDMGEYQCGFSVNDTQRGTSELWIAPKIVEVETPLVQIVSVGSVEEGDEGRGEDVLVKCKVLGENYDIVWRLGGVAIASNRWKNNTLSSSRYEVLSSGSLLIKSNNLGDSGCYQCFVGNRAGNSTARIQLIATVTGRPTGAATEASRCPPPETTTASPANNGSGPIGGEGGANGCQILEDVSFSDDSGNDVDAIGTLSPSPTDDHYAPVFPQLPSPCIQTTVGYTVDIVCVTIGNPSPDVWWVKDDVIITGQQAAADSAYSTPLHYQQLAHNTLRIHTVQENDSGIYECVAQNSEGRHSAVTTVRVRGQEDVCGLGRSASGEGWGGGEGGRRFRRITEGMPVTSAQQFPWQVLIEYHRRLHSDKLCGGTLLRPDWLLTAAHCLHVGNQWIAPSDLRIRVGVVNRTTFEPTQQYLEADVVIPHPSYNTTFQILVNKVPEFDIALIRLKKPARLTSSVRPACLPVSHNDPPVGTMCRVSGWGHLSFQRGPSPSTLHHTHVPIVNYSDCRHADSYGTAVTRKHLCAGFHEGGPDACQNDSGGPLVCEHRGQWRLFGVVNRGLGCGGERKYGLYARVIRFNSWIQTVMATPL